MTSSQASARSPRSRAIRSAFKELLRRIAQHHLAAGDAGHVQRSTAEAALHEMLFAGGTLNARLLGGAVPTA